MRGHGCGPLGSSYRSLAAGGAIGDGEAGAAFIRGHYQRKENKIIADSNMQPVRYPSLRVESYGSAPTTQVFHGAYCPAGKMSLIHRA